MTLSYPRRQQLRRLTRAGTRAIQAGVALAAAAFCVQVVESALAAALLAVVAALAVSLRRSLRLAARSRVGAESEAQVRRALQPRTREGWHLQHAFDWPGPGDLDHIIRSPSGIGFVIETKTLRYTHAHLVRTADAACWLARRRRRHPHAVLPVICVTRARSIERVEGPVLVVSLDCLMPVLLRQSTRRPNVARDPWVNRTGDLKAGGPSFRLDRLARKSTERRIADAATWAAELMPKAGASGVGVCALALARGCGGNPPSPAAAGESGDSMKAGADRLRFTPLRPPGCGCGAS